MKFILVFLVTFMVVAANMEEGMIASLGFDPDILKVALVAFVLTGLIFYHNIALVLLVILLAVGANLPQETLNGFGIDRYALIATLIALVALPKIKQWLE